MVLNVRASELEVWKGCTTVDEGAGLGDGDGLQFRAQSSLLANLGQISKFSVYLRDHMIIRNITERSRFIICSHV